MGFNFLEWPFRMKDVNSAVLDFKKALDLNPGYKQLVEHLLGKYFEENEEKQRGQMRASSSQSSYMHFI